MAAKILGGDGRVDGDQPFTRPAVALVITTWALAERLYVRGARTPEPVIRYVFKFCAPQTRLGFFLRFFLRADDQEGGLFQGFRLFVREIFWIWCWCFFSLCHSKFLNRGGSICPEIRVAKTEGSESAKKRVHHSLKLPLCSCVSITLPASS